MNERRLGGNFFEDLGPGQLLRHPVPRTVSDGDIALYIALTGDRNPLHCLKYPPALESLSQQPRSRITTKVCDRP